MSANHILQNFLSEEIFLEWKYGALGSAHACKPGLIVPVLPCLPDVAWFDDVIEA